MGTDISPNARQSASASFPDLVLRQAYSFTSPLCERLTRLSLLIAADEAIE
jgi:hypothetical protein